MEKNALTRSAGFERASASSSGGLKTHLAICRKFRRPSICSISMPMGTEAIEIIALPAECETLKCTPLCPVRNGLPLGRVSNRNERVVDRDVSQGRASGAREFQRTRSEYQILKCTVHGGARRR